MQQIILQTRENFTNIINDFKYLQTVEIGVRRGNFSEFLLKNTKPMMHYAIDGWSSCDIEGSANHDEEEARQRLGMFPNCIIIKKMSKEASYDFEDESLDFIYIDACHQYEYVKEDIKLWYPKIKNGGVIAGHDFDRDAWPGVVKAVEEMATLLNKDIMVTGIGSTYGNDGGDGIRPSWWWFK